MRKKPALLHEFDDNVAVVATTVASITAGIVRFQAKWRPRRSLFQIGVRFAYRRGVCGGSGRGSCASAGQRLPTSVSPQASSNDRSRALANATSERSVSQREHRKRYGTFALRNAWLFCFVRLTVVAHIANTSCAMCIATVYTCVVTTY